MLWERADAATELRRRFGLTDATTAAGLITTALADHWDLRVTACERIVLSNQNFLAWVRAHQGPFVVKACAWQPLFARLGAVAEVVARLGARGLPVAAPRRTLSGAARAIINGPTVLSAVLLPEITGDLLDAGDSVAVRATGETLARVHLALAQLDVRLPKLPPLMAPQPLVGAEPLLRRARAGVGRRRAPRAAARLDALLADLPDLDVVPTLVHGDVRGANVLVEAGQVSALLDYDSMTMGHRVHDLAAGAVKLATRFRSWDPPPPNTCRHLVAGYRSVITLTSAEEHWLKALVIAEGIGQIPRGADPAGWASAVDRGL